MSLEDLQIGSIWFVEDPTSDGRAFRGLGLRVSLNDSQVLCLGPEALSARDLWGP